MTDAAQRRNFLDLSKDLKLVGSSLIKYVMLEMNKFSPIFETFATESERKKGILLRASQ